MSYILDALKRSEQARGSRKKNLGLIDPPDSRPPLKSIVRWLYVIAFMLFLNAGLFAFWLHPWHRDVNTDSKRNGISGGQSETSRQTGPTGQPAPPVLTGDKPGASANQPEENEKPTLNPSEPVPVVASGKKEDGRSRKEPAGPASDAVRPARPDAPAMHGHGTAKDYAGEYKSHDKGTGAKQDQKPGAHRPSQTPAQPPSASPGGPGTTEAAVQMSDIPKLSQDSTEAGTKDGSKPSKQPGLKKTAEPAARLQPRQGDGIISDLQDFAKLEESASKPASTIPKWHELAPEIRDAIPNLIISMLIYSQRPENRWININGSKKQEGQEISSGLKLEQITRDGAIFSYRGQRFFKRVVGD